MSPQEARAAADAKADELLARVARRLLDERLAKAGKEKKS